MKNSRQRSGQRQENQEGGSFADFAPHFDAASVSFDQMLGNRETEAGASQFAGPRGIDPVKPFENAFLVYPGDADARV